MSTEQFSSFETPEVLGTDPVKDLEGVVKERKKITLSSDENAPASLEKVLKGYAAFSNTRTETALQQYFSDNSSKKQEFDMLTAQLPKAELERLLMSYPILQPYNGGDYFYHVQDFVQYLKVNKNVFANINKSKEVQAKITDFALFAKKFLGMDSTDPVISGILDTINASLAPRRLNYEVGSDQKDLKEKLTALKEQLSKEGITVPGTTVSVQLPETGKKSGLEVDTNVMVGYTTAELDPSKGILARGPESIINQISQNQTVRDALELILGDLGGGKIQRNQIVSGVEKSYTWGKDLATFQFGDNPNNTFSVGLRSGMEVGTSRLSPQSGLTNPKNLTYILPGGESFFLLKDAVTDAVNKNSGADREQRSVTLLGGVELGLKMQQAKARFEHTLGLNAITSFDEGFEAGKQYFGNNQATFDLVGSVLGQEVKQRLEKLLTTSPGKYSVMGIPIAAGGAVKYMLTIVPIDTVTGTDKKVSYRVGAGFDFLKNTFMDLKQVMFLGGLNITF